MTTNKQLLAIADIELTDKVLREALGEYYNVYADMLALLANEGVEVTWRFYRDSKAWLCKAAYKKRTMFWMSVDDGFMRVNFYFMPRHLEGIMVLGIDENSYKIADEWGKMIPITFLVSHKEQLPDVLKMVEFKKKAK